MTQGTKTELIALFLAEVSWAVLLVGSRYAVAGLTLDPFIFATIQLLFGGIVLTLLSRQPIRIRDFLLEKHTLLYGLSRVGTGAFFTAALVHITASSASLLGILNVTVGMFVLFAFHQRIPRTLELFGHAVVAAGFIMLCARLEDGFSNPAVWYMLASEVCVAISTIVAEKHPQNQGDDWSRRTYLTGVLLTVSGFLTVIATISVFLSYSLVVGAKLSVDGIELVSQLARPEIWIAGALFGILLRGPVVYFSLRAINLAGGQSYLAFSALLPFLSLGLEKIAQTIGYGDAVTTTPTQIAIGLFMVCGSLWILACQQHWPIIQRLSGKKNDI